jgi:hypothetical protein
MEAGQIKKGGYVFFSNDAIWILVVGEPMCGYEDEVVQYCSIRHNILVVV